jgi:GTP cyclohydrolase I
MKKVNKQQNTSSAISVKNLDLQTPIKHLLLAMGENVERDGIKQTPKRFEKAMKSILSGYDRTFEAENKVFDNTPHFKDMIIFKNIDFFSLCEHHLLPFFGFAHIAYIPSEKKYLGISKLARVVDIYARRLQTQEVLSSQIADALMAQGNAKGVAVLLESMHLCAVARGVEKKAAIMSTCGYYGTFESDQRLQRTFLELVRKRETV